ncbi:MAG: hypothetical protein ACFFCS_11055 [Candidatus Hodarchaeota archaeon]
MGEDPFDALDALTEPIDKDANKTKMLEKLQGAFSNGTPFIDYCKDYVYAMIPEADGNWKEYSYITEDGQLTKNDRDPEMAYLVIKEEVVRGLPEVVEGLNVTEIQEITDSHLNDPKAVIADLIAKLAANVPVVRSEADVQKAIDIVQNS